MSLRLAVVLVVGLGSTAVGQVPIGAPRVRDWEVPQPPLVVERPPRVYREVTQTYELGGAYLDRGACLGGGCLDRGAYGGYLDRGAYLDRGPYVERAAAVEVPRVYERPVAVDVRRG